jgi:hypothetical protein
MRALVEPAAAAVRDITRPAPCTVLNSPSRWASRPSGSRLNGEMVKW